MNRNLWTRNPSEREKRRAWGTRSDRPRFDPPRSRTGRPAIIRSIQSARVSAERAK